MTKTLLQMSGAPPASITLADAALVVIDGQEDYRSGLLPLYGMEGAVERLGVLLATARQGGMPVIHVVHRGKPGGLLDLHGPGGAIMPELEPRVGEPIMEKTLPNAFAGTKLEEHVRAAGRRTLLLAGFMTHNCVEATARAALDLGIPAAVMADATATRALPDPLGGPALSAEVVQVASLAALADRTAQVICVATLVPE